MIFYILKTAIILAGCLAFYKLLLQKETFFPLNRFILLACLALSFSLPLLPVSERFSFRKATPAAEVENQVEQSAITSQAVKTPVVIPAPSKQPEVNAMAETAGFFENIPVVKTLIWGYWIGVIIFGLNFLVQLATLLIRAYSRPVIRDGRYRIVELSGDQAPCSFGNNIFINPEKYEWETYSQIILHEKVHIQQGHSYDILLAELALIFQWFNPFAWLYRKAMEDNLEFLTDNELLAHKEVERSSYQMSLVKVSAPHFPLTLTTNYNQSILKKRLIMMNAKKSNVHTTWKYLFILPLLMVFVCLLNEPTAYGKPASAKNAGAMVGLEKLTSEGFWFATIKADKITFRFEKDDEGNNRNSSTFDLSEFKNLPRDKEGDFSLSRDAGTIEFNGKFSKDMGMGKYKFVPNAGFVDYLEKEGIVAAEKDLIVFFMVNVTKSYVAMLKAEGFKNIKKDDLIPLAALKVDGNYIKSLKTAGYDALTLKNLIPLKALNVDADYINDLKKATSAKLSVDRLITLKAQGIDGEFLKNNSEATAGLDINKNINTVISKNINKRIGTDLRVESTERTERTETAEKPERPEKPEKGEKGYKGLKDDDEFGEIIAKKILGVTPEYIKSFTNIGYNLTSENLMAFKSLGITAEFVKAMEAEGFTKADIDDIAGAKAVGLTIENIKAYKALGFKKLGLGDMIGAYATGTTPDYISAMRKKGYSYDDIGKYISRKTLSFLGNID